MTKEQFYTKCAEILDIPYEFKDITYNTSRKNRWGPRQKGNGTYESFGLIRYFSSHMIVISTREYVKVFENVDNVFQFLKRNE